MEVIEVADPGDPRLDDFRDLMDADVRPDRRGIVIAEGLNVVTRLARSAYPMRAVIGVPKRIEALRWELADREVPAYVCDKWTLSDVVGFRVTRGVLAAASRPHPPDPQHLLATARCVVVLEGLNDFENLGALFRNAAAFGIDAVVLDQTCADPLYRRSVRVSMGHVLRVPFAVLPGAWPDALEQVKRHGLRLLAMTPREEADDLRALPAPPRWALMLGAEGPGLSEGALDAADQLVRIPMAGGVDSLNVATAGAVAFSYLT
ncbi:MAG: TrmH family RNA methyltransferase [Jatrophihabitantaceae bacterium]